MTRFFRFIFLFIILLHQFHSHADITQDHDKTTDSLLELAKNKKIFSLEAWHLLMHYQPYAGDHFYGEVDDPKFYLASDGKKNPESEGIESLRALLLGETSQCLFPARMKWLKKILNLDEKIIPKVDCKEYQDFKKSL